MKPHIIAVDGEAAGMTLAGVVAQNNVKITIRKKEFSERKTRIKIH